MTSFCSYTWIMTGCMLSSQGWETQQEEIQSDSTEADNDSDFIGGYKYEPDGNVSTVL